MLLEQIEKDLKQAILNRDEEKKNALRMVKGEVPRLNLKAGEKPTDKQIEKIINSLIKSEIIVIEYSGQETSPFIENLKPYLPKMMNENEIRGWIAMHVTLDEYNPTIKAMGYIMKELKGRANGNMVRNILLEIEKKIKK